MEIDDITSFGFVMKCNDCHMLCDVVVALLNNNGLGARLFLMRYIILIYTIFMVTTANAACYASYKAKRDDPLKLHYGVMQLPDQQCTVKTAAKAAGLRLLPHGWILLNLLTVSSKIPTPTEKENAGENFLRY